MEYLKTVNRTIAIGNRRVVITFDENNVPIIHSGILPGDYLCWSRKRGWYCSASADNPGNIVGIFINEKGNYLPVKALTEAPCSSKDVKLYKMPSLRDLKEIENVRDILDNSLAAAGFAKLPGDLLSAFWSCDDRFYNRIKRPLIIDSYNKLCEKYQIKNEPFLKLQGMVVTTFAEEGKPELDLRKNHKLLLVSTGAKDVSNQIFWVLYEFSPNVFYVLNDKLVASNPLKTEDYKKLLSMPEVRKRIYFPEADMKNLMFVYEDGTLSEQVEQKMILGIPFTFRDGARAIVRPYPFVIALMSLGNCAQSLSVFRIKNGAFLSANIWLSWRIATVSGKCSAMLALMKNGERNGHTVAIRREETSPTHGWFRLLGLLAVVLIGHIRIFRCRRAYIQP